ncbi:MAG: hypothetical protein ACFFBP_20120, partial [Promethearchaeota archaeon]
SIIANAIKRTYWINYNFYSWNGLIKDIFGKPNKTYGIWTGKNGLIKAKEFISDFYKSNHRRPVNKDKGMSGIVNALKRKYWVEYGIISWTQLVDMTLENDKKDFKI